MAKVNLKHSGAVIDQQIDRVIDGSVVVENTLSALDENSNKPVSGKGVAEAINAASNNLKARGYIYMGVATPTTTPDVSGGKVFYLAAQAGSYPNFDTTIASDMLTSLAWNGERWIAVRIADLVTPAEVEKAILDNTASEVTADGVTPVSGKAVYDALAPTSELAEKNKEDIGAILSSFGEQDFMYGVEWDTTNPATAMVRIGNSELHRTLPIHNMMRGCLLDDDGNVLEYLPRKSWVGQTLDGSKGQVMVEIPEHYRYFEEEGTIRRCKLSLYALPNYHKVPKMYISAYEATVQRSTTKLCSVVNTDADYRGGNNNSAWDGTYRTLLGRPATVISRTNFRNYARKRKSSTTEWNCQDYNAYKAVFWLYYVEYANRNCQLAFNAEKDANGYAQGGLGNGITTVSGTAWREYNGYYPFAPCGHTDELGNGSGEVAYEALKEDGSVWATVYANRYRGIENPFGHIWKWTDGINIKISPTEENGGDNTSKVFVADNPANYNDTGYDGYAVQGLEARTEGYVRQLVFGEQGDIMPAVAGGSSTTYWADYHYTNIPTSEALRGVLFGGNASNGASAGFGFAYSFYAPSAADAPIGSRLCFIPAKE